MDEYPKYKKIIYLVFCNFLAALSITVNMQFNFIETFVFLKNLGFVKVEGKSLYFLPPGRWHVLNVSNNQAFAYQPIFHAYVIFRYVKVI